MASTINASTSAGLVSTADTSGVLQLQTAGTTAVTVDASQNVGIGTSSPLNKLVVSNAGANGLEINPISGISSGVSFNGYNRSTSAYTPLTYAALSHYFQVGSSPATAATLDSSGNLGLGVTPNAWFSNRKAFEIGGSVSTVTGANITIFGNNYYTDTGGTNRYVTTGSAAQQMLFPQAGGVQWFNAPSGTAGNAVTFTQAMTLDDSGNLLVGETSAKYSAASRGLIEVNGTGSALLGLSVNNTAAGYLYSNGVSVYVGAPTGYNILFDINGEKMRLDSSGNLGVGTTANASAIIDAQSTTKGVRMPNMTTTQKNAIASPAAGLMVFDTTLAKLCVYSGSAWQTITSV